MPNFIDINYSTNGESVKTNDMGMRDMQSRVFESRNSKYLLIKAPPASGKSRALMFLGLDKIYNQNIKKVIVAVPERSIGKSFFKTKLSDKGFFTDWDYNENFNLCTPGTDQSKVKSLAKFLELDDEQICICTHATLRFTFDKYPTELFNNTLVAIDEFHHVSSAIESKLGEVVNSLMNKTNSHLIAMTGSYFRGDNIPVLKPEDEAKFDSVTYNYYEQLNGYKYLKSLGIGYHFYQGGYLDSLSQVLDSKQKTILYIPNVNSGESTKDKYKEVDFILDFLGEFISQDSVTGVIKIEDKKNNKILKVADLVNDNPKDRDKIETYLNDIDSADDIDIIIALGKAKEGFDWPYCEHALAIGYRGSMTEVIQIIGRATRDAENKTHAQYTNMIAQPDADDSEIKVSVNNMLKAISASLLMEQVLAPNIKFQNIDYPFPIDDRTIKVGGYKKPTSQKVIDIINNDLNDLKANILQDEQIIKATPGGVDPTIITKVLIPKIIQNKYPDLSSDEAEQVRQHIVLDSNIKVSDIKEVGGKKFVRMADTFINIEDLHIDLIDKINPFEKAFEVLSKEITPKLLQLIGDVIQIDKINISDEEAKKLYYEELDNFMKLNNDREPSINSINPKEKRLAEALIHLRNRNREYQRMKKNNEI